MEEIYSRTPFERDVERNVSEAVFGSYLCEESKIQQHTISVIVSVEVCAGACIDIEIINVCKNVVPGRSYVCSVTLTA